MRAGEVKRSTGLRRPRIRQIECTPQAGRLPELRAPDLGALPGRRLRAMLMAGVEALECRRVLERGGINLVSEVLRGQGEFVEYEHYPKDDVYDSETGAQYYYHAHRGGAGEHGHFHTFLRWPRQAPDGSSPADPAMEMKTDEAGSVTHIIAVSMDSYGWPIGLFATNHWVCGGAWLAADEVIALLPRFRIDHAYPSWPVNRWISAMLILFRPHIEALLLHRDQVIARWAHLHPGTDVLEDRELDITGSLPISVEALVQELRALAGTGRLM